MWCTAGLTQQPVTIISHEHCAYRFKTDVPDTLAKKQEAEPGQWDDVQLVPPDELIDQTCTLDPGGLIMELHHLPGHTEDCLIGILPEHGIALMGDTIETPFPVVPQGGDLSAWVKQLKRWEQVPELTSKVPCHGPMGDRELISQTIDYLERLRRGDSFDLPARLTPFYEQTHASNLRWRDE